MKRAPLHLLLILLPACWLVALGCRPVLAQNKKADEPAARSSATNNAYKSDPGPCKIRTVPKVTLENPSRKKELQLRINYPEGPGPFPVIIWSHGAYGSKDAYQPITVFWASHGYVVIQPTHEDSAALGNRPGDPKVFQTWRSRPADVAFIIDSFPAIEAKESALKGQLDVKRIGIGGHSFGANTAQIVGGAKTRESAGAKSYADPRVIAVMVLSGQGPGEMLTADSWREFSKPLFVMTGSKDGPTRTGEPAEWRKKPYELSPPGNKYLVWVEGLDHGYGGFTGVRGNPSHVKSADHVLWTKMTTLAFWDAFLKQSGDGREYLASEKITEFSGGAVALSRK